MPRGWHLRACLNKDIEDKHVTRLSEAFWCLTSTDSAKCPDALKTSFPCLNYMLKHLNVSENQEVHNPKSQRSWELFCIPFDEMLPFCPSALLAFPALLSGMSYMHTTAHTPHVRTPDSPTAAIPHGRAGDVSESTSRCSSRSRRQHCPHLRQLPNPNMFTAARHYTAIVKAAHSDILSAANIAVEN